MIRDFRGVIRVRKTTSNANTTIEIDDCIIKGLQGGHYGILHASDITGSSGAGSLASLKLNLTNSTIANFIGAASSIVRTANTQQNVTTNIENCTFYGLTTSGEQLMRDITGATCTFNVSNTLFAASNTNYKSLIRQQLHRQMLVGRKFMLLVTSNSLIQLVLQHMTL